jgi:cupin superfamily acireductone dioxygenase involved in methionine salvage
MGKKCKSKARKIWEILCGNNNTEKYDTAIDNLDKIYKTVNSIGMVCNDFHSFDFEVKKNIWTCLPKEVAKGVEVMGLHIEDDFRSVLTHHTIKSEIQPHLHSEEWEIIQILEGSCHDTMTNTRLSKGDVYIIPKGMKHHIVTDSEECYMYNLFTESSEYLVISNSEPDLAKKFIKKRKLKQPEKIK